MLFRGICEAAPDISPAHYTPDQGQMKDTSVAEAEVTGGEGQLGGALTFNSRGAIELSELAETARIRAKQVVASQKEGDENGRGAPAAKGFTGKASLGKPSAANISKGREGEDKGRVEEDDSTRRAVALLLDSIGHMSGQRERKDCGG